MLHQLAILVPTPAHRGLGPSLSYVSEQALPPGTLVRVPLGRRETLGVVWSGQPQGDGVPLDTDKLRPVQAVFEALGPLSAHWQALVSFTARYYQRSIGEVALAALPPALRQLSPAQWSRRLARQRKQGAVATAQEPAAGVTRPEATSEQNAALLAMASQRGPFLLFGSTGSGKTEVYLRLIEDLLERDPLAQALVMVPEINLTPQLEARVRERLCPRWGSAAVVCQHSGMTPAQRLNDWLAAHQGRARVMLGTRMAVLASLPGLRLIIVDEEHDPSYKQQEGARYSARDLAVYRGQLEGAQVVLGSATPSLESWQHSAALGPDQPGRYRRLLMSSRIGDMDQSGRLPQVRLVDMRLLPRQTILAPALLAAIEQRVARGEQALLLLNRRGYAPVLHCHACGWKSDCAYCSAYRVFHKIDKTLRCHHCGHTERVPRACPGCGNPDISTLGRGTEQLQEHLVELLAGLTRPDGQAIRVGRIDADTTRQQGQLQQQLAQVHSGEVDVLVGTQMVAKGHDFRCITLVAALNPDGALFASDFRAPERLFALLMQAAGRAGRDARHGARSEMWIQTQHPEHPLFAALRRHDYPGFATQQLAERQQAAMPPFSFQALLRAEARSQAVAQGFLQAAATLGAQAAATHEVTLYPAVPMTVQRVADVERAQMLLESASRQQLQRFLSSWQADLHTASTQPEAKGLLRWAVDVDPLAI